MPRPSRSDSALPFLGRIALVLTLAALAAPAGAIPGPVPAALDPDADDPDALRERLLAHRIQEAESKARFVEELERGAAPRTANQYEWDALHYDVDLDVDPTTHLVSGTVTTTAEVLVPSLTTLDFNLYATMTVLGATSGAGLTTWTRTNNVVTVDLDRAYTLGETVVVSLAYSGDPAGSSFGWSSADGADMIWTLSEPFGARAWWPCKDHNWDKADSLDLHVNVPDPLIVASNGLLQSATPSGGWTDYHWKTRYPIATYLVSLAIHPYTTFSHSYTPIGGGPDMPVDYYVYASHYSTVQATYALTVPMIEVFAAGYGEYPFVDEKYGHAEFVWGGGMEHQTLTSLGGWSEDLISHELAHQWWGDLVTCDNFRHIWLNEGFATWSEAYWKEQTEGIGTYRQYMDAAAYYGPGTIYVENPNFDDIFDVNLSYNKASWVVHMLRHVVGDVNFFDGLADYRSLYAYGTATTEQLRDVMAEISGIDLDAFFQQWIYGEYYPIYRPTWSVTTPGTVDLTIEQVQTETGLFTMPIDVRVTTTDGTFDFVVQNSLAVENYSLSVSGDVESVQIDPDRWILREVETFVTDPTFDAGILVVNGVDWGTYDTEIRSAYADSTFWGDLPFTFWDNFAEPAGGYPANLPAPLGHGPVPADLLGDFSAVVWIGNDYNGDLPKWQETPIESYLEAGGNVLLLSRRGSSFVNGDLQTYLGITWTSTSVTLGSSVAVHPSLVDNAFTGTQSLNSVFSTTLGPNSTQLFESSIGPGDPHASGVIVEPPGGGSHRPDGGRFAFVSGRPYRMDHADLRSNVVTILEDFFGEPYAPPVVDSPVEVATAGRFALEAARPNPFRDGTRIAFELPAAGDVDLAIYDVTGRLVRTLATGPHPAGARTVTWDGADESGRRAAAGVYFVRLRAGDEVRTRPVVRLR
jgi:hypothetical protein